MEETPGSWIVGSIALGEKDREALVKESPRDVDAILVVFVLMRNDVNTSFYSNIQTNDDHKPSGDQNAINS